ncbi:hypothetical protein [Ferrovum sp. PN-J185]|uniref:hypothetical protein n=1 Tax=Ferrovum sp. PN-J185 TaxID=1356306 RepID=UPI000791A763|nr:hypothetical protein [Ferrovum sp. PN-J185]KXW55482.1 hypothetical protein FV185_12490 [Ferrovum sp. PN-J185]
MIEDIKYFISQCNWTFAKTMPESPHWYIVRNKENNDDFVKFVMFIRENGQTRTWNNRKFIYLDIDNYSYWTMGNPISDTTIINKVVLS